MAEPKTQFDRLPQDGSMVGRAEDFVRVASHRLAANSAAMVQAVVGKTGRPFGSVPMTGQEAYARYKMLRAGDDPNAWQVELAMGDPKRIRQRWTAFEQQYRDEQRQKARDPMALLAEMQNGGR